MSEADDRKKGREWFEKVMGFPAPPLEGDAFLDVTLEHLFANVWSRPGLGVRERRIATLVVLMCLGHEATLKLHLGAALRTGQLTDAEVDELVVHVAHYAGWPVAAVTSQVLRGIRAERAGAKAGG
jgi:4-carboxymuconolactone decarboxylase